MPHPLNYAAVHNGTPWDTFTGILVKATQHAASWAPDAIDLARPLLPYIRLLGKAAILKAQILVLGHRRVALG